MVDEEKQDPLIEEIVRQAEVYLSAQVALATSADQRAAVMASVFSATGAAIVAGLIAFVADADRVSGGTAIIAGGIVAGVLFLVGSGLCVWATMPVGFDLPGSSPSMWKKDRERGISLHRALDEQADNYQNKIQDNRATLKRNAARFKWGAIAGIAAPMVGFLVWFSASIC